MSIWKDAPRHEIRRTLDETVKLFREIAKTERNFARVMRRCGFTQTAEIAEGRAARLDDHCDRDKRVW